MSRRHRQDSSRAKQEHASSGAPTGAAPPEPVDVRDGIPDRSGRPARGRVLWILLIFLGWVGVLIWIGLAGRM